MIAAHTSSTVHDTSVRGEDVAAVGCDTPKPVTSVCVHRPFPVPAVCRHPIPLQIVCLHRLRWVAPLICKANSLRLFTARTTQLDLVSNLLPFIRQQVVEVPFAILPVGILRPSERRLVAGNEGDELNQSRGVLGLLNDSAATSLNIVEYTQGIIPFLLLWIALVVAVAPPPTASPALGMLARAWGAKLIIRYRPAPGGI